MLHLGVLHHRVVHPHHGVHVGLHVHALLRVVVFASVRVCLRAVGSLAGQGLLARYLWVPLLAF